MDPARSLAAAESAFAAHSVREDMRVAFLANFADDGVFVRQGWTLAKASLEPQKAPPIVLDWRPVYTEVARSGELGLSTGPWKITSKAAPGEAPRFGQYVSIWRLSPDGRWQVLVDLGISHPQSAFWEARLEAVNLPPEAPAAQDLVSAEERFAAAARGGLQAAYASFGADNVRIYRVGAQPVVGKSAALASAAMAEPAVAWKVERSETARSGDFGYVRGSYASPSDPGRTLGHYLRVWRVENGRWRIVLDVTNPAG